MNDEEYDWSCCDPSWERWVSGLIWWQENEGGQECLRKFNPQIKHPSSPGLSHYTDPNTDGVQTSETPRLAQLGIAAYY